MHPKVEGFLTDLKKLLEKNNADHIGMYRLRMYHRKLRNSEFRWIMRELVSNRKIEIFDPDQKIRLV